MSKLKQGQLGYIRAEEDRREYPKGAVVMVLTRNTPEKEYQVTHLINDEPTNSNPYILENEETGFKITKKQFDTAEFVPYHFVKPIDLSYKHPVVEFLTESFVAHLALCVLLSCTSALAALKVAGLL